MKKLKFVLFVLVLVTLYVNIGRGQNATNGDYRTRGSGNWNGTTTWQVRTTGSWVNTNILPNSNSTIYVQGSHTLTVNVMTADCYNLNIHLNGVVTIGSNTLQVSGKIRAYTGTGYTTEGADGTFYSGQASSVNPVNAMIITSGVGVLKFIGSTRNITISNEWAGNMTNYATEFALLSNNTGTLQTGYKASSILISSGIIDMESNRLAPDNGTSGQGNVTILEGATLISSGSGSSTPVISRTGTTVAGTFNLKGNLVLSGSSPQIEFTTIIIGNEGTVIYNGGSQTMLKSSYTNGVQINSYNNLSLTGTLAKKLSANTTVNGTLSIQGTASLSLNYFTLTYGNSAILEYAGNSAQTTSLTEWPSSSGLPPNVNVNNSLGLSINADKAVNGNLTLTTGALSIGANTLTINGAVSGSGTLIGGSLSNITFGGNGVSTTLPAVTLNNLYLNRANGIGLGGNVSVAGTLTLSSGKLSLGVYDLTLSSSSTALSSISVSNYIVTNGAGSLIRNNNNTTETLFPIGTTDAYSPVWITNTGTSGAYTINVEPDATGSNSGADRLKLKWTVNGPGGSNTKLRIGWLTSQEGSNFTSNRSTYAKLWHLYGGAWVSAGTATLASGSGEFVNYTLYASNITTYSPFGSGYNESAMPVTLSSFNFTIKGRNVKLNWVTSSEQNNSGFEIQRADSGCKNFVFNSLAFVPGKGNSNAATNYEYADSKLNSGKYRYRLKQLDFNGNFEYYDLNSTVEIGMPEKFNLSQNYPNPFNPTTKIDFDLPQDSKVCIKVFDILGEEVTTLVNDFRRAGYYTVLFEKSSLSSGVYFYRIIAGDNKFVMTKKLLLLK